MSAPLSPEREAEIVARLDDEDRTATELTDIVAELLAEVDRLRNTTTGLLQGAERQEARTDHIAKQALRWKAEADGRKEYGEKLRAELAALSAPVVETAFRDALARDELRDCFLSDSRERFEAAADAYRVEVIAERDAQIIAWLVKKAREEGTSNKESRTRADAIFRLADKLSRGAVRPPLSKGPDQVNEALASARRAAEAVFEQNAGELHPKWRVVITDSESPTGIAVVCTGDRSDALHMIDDFPGGPQRDDEGVYDCCPWPQIETYSTLIAAYLVELLNADSTEAPAVTS
ncbi:hypothetical protein ACWEAF_26285 [Streptomyces sp. NPDC005071]